MTIDEARATIDNIADQMSEEKSDEDADALIGDAVRAGNAYLHSIATSLERIASATEVSADADCNRG